MAADEEQGNVGIHYITGFGELASFIASDADHTTAVYKRFDKLAARDLLYYECELLELEALQDQYDREDAIDARRLDKADLQRLIRTNARDWLSFKQRAMKEDESNDENNERWKKRMDLAMEIRSALKAYRKALVLNSTLLTLHPPPKQTLTTLSNYFHQQHVISGSQASQQTTSSKLSGAASSALYPLPDAPASQQATDLISLSPRTHIDPLSYFLKTYCSWLFEVRCESTPTISSPSTTGTASYSTKPPITHLHPQRVGTYSLRTLSFTVSLVTTFLASIMLFLPIYVLYKTPSTRSGVKLSLIALFTLLFAGVIPLVTNARRAEVFAACAAYAAVLVVFVSGDLGGGGAVANGGTGATN